MESRKKSKPLMEKKRRARINSSLSELKSLLQDVIQEEGARHNKMEKADVLEMTVRYLRRMHQQRHSGRPSTVNRYRMGFNECLSEVRKFLKNSDCLDPELHPRILEHLVNHSFENESKTNLNESSGKISPAYDVNNNGRVDSPTTNQIQRIGNATPPLTNQIQDIGNATAQLTNQIRRVENTPPPLAPKVQTTFAQLQQTSMPLNCASASQTVSPVQAAQTNYPVYNMVQQMNQSPQVQTIPSPSVVNGIQLIPTKLVSGQVAFILPTNQVQTSSVINCAVTNQTQILQAPTSLSISPSLSNPHTQLNTIPANTVMGATVFGSQNHVINNSSSAFTTFPQKPMPSFNNNNDSLISPANSLIALSNSSPRVEKHLVTESAQVWRPW